jgi:guanine deaminase
VNIGIGTDGVSSSDNSNPFEAMRAAAFVSRMPNRHPDAWLRAEEVFEMATLGSARVLGFESRLGRITPGYKADLVLLDLEHPHYLPMNNAVNQLVYAEDGTGISGVVADGRVIVENGRLLTVNLAHTRARVEEAVARLREMNRSRRELAQTLEPIVMSVCSSLASLSSD